MRKKSITKAVIVVTVVIMIVWIAWDNYRIGISYYTIQNSRLPDAFEGYRIVQVSDLHNAQFGEKQSRLIEKIKNENPDMIAITGDLIDSNHTNIEVAMQLVNAIAKIAPVYYVTGNHEAWTKEYETKLRPKLLESGVTIMEDTSVSLERGGQSILLLGISDPAMEVHNDMFGESRAIVETKLDKMEVDGYSILLSHRPELLSVYAEKEVSLVLSGHAHGGQIRIPFVGGLIAPDQGLFPKYTSGVYTEESTQMVVSRGIGESVIPIRVNNCPELVVVDLKK